LLSVPTLDVAGDVEYKVDPVTAIGPVPPPNAYEAVVANEAVPNKEPVIPFVTLALPLTSKVYCGVEVPIPTLAFDTEPKNAVLPVLK